MKKALLVLLFLPYFFSFSQAQSSRFYFAKIISSKGAQSGLLYAVTKDSLMLQTDKDKMIAFKPNEIEVITIKIFKKRELKNFLKGVEVEDSRYEKIPNSDIKVLKPGEKEPTLGEVIGEKIAIGAMSLVTNALINSVALTLYDDKIAKIKLNYSDNNYQQQMTFLSWHSFKYIINPDTKAELAKIRAISLSNKP